jgi:hypothetical protein
MALRNDELLEKLWAELLESAERFRRKYRLLPNGTMVDRAAWQAITASTPNGERPRRADGSVRWFVEPPVTQPRTP